MRIALVLGLLAGCSLYSGDDEPIDPGVDAAPMPAIAGDWSVSWQCAGDECVTPHVAANNATVSLTGTAAVIRWTSAAGEVATHAGVLSPTMDCIGVNAGGDEGAARAQYDLCLLSGDRAVAGIQWNETSWRADFTR